MIKHILHNFSIEVREKSFGSEQMKVKSKWCHEAADAFEKVTIGFDLKMTIETSLSSNGLTYFNVV